MLAVLADHEPGAIEAAFAEAPAKTKTRAGLKRALELLETTAHARAIELVRAL